MRDSRHWRLCAGPASGARSGGRSRFAVPEPLRDLTGVVANELADCVHPVEFDLAQAAGDTQTGHRPALIVEDGSCYPAAFRLVFDVIEGISAQGGLPEFRNQ